MKRRSGFSGCAGALAAVLLLVAPTLQAGSDDTTSYRIPVELSTIDECIGEIADFSGTVHMVVQWTDNRDGSTTLTSRVNYANMKGVGRDSGASYSFQQNSVSITTMPTPGYGPVYVTAKVGTRIRSAGSGPNSRITFETQYIITGPRPQPVTITFSDFRLKCTPD